MVRHLPLTCTSVIARQISTTNPQFPAVCGLAGTMIQSRSPSRIKPADCGPPATALGEMAAVMACAAKPSATVAPRTAPSLRQGRSLTSRVSRPSP